VRGARYLVVDKDTIAHWSQEPSTTTTCTNIDKSKLRWRVRVLKHANYSLLAVTTVMQYCHVAVRLLALRVINARVHVRFHRAALLPELVHPRYISRQAMQEPVERQDRSWGLD